jgi:iron complex outermembrane receptor protein
MSRSFFRTLAVSTGGVVMLMTSALTQQVVAQEETLEEITVTGSYLRSSEDSISPLEFIDADQMQNVPSTTLGDFFFLDLTQNVGLDSGYDEGGAQGRNTNASRGGGVDLRGLGKQNTLTLIDGRRTIEHGAPDGNGWRNVDINMLMPRIAVGRAEILLDGGSAIYGTDAVAGVVNMVPRYDFRGIEVQADTSHYQEDFGAQNWSGGIIGGWGNDDTSIIAAFDYHQQDRSNTADIGLRERNFSPGTSDDEFLERNSNGLNTFQALAPGKGGALSGSGALLPDPLCGDSATLGLSPLESGFLGDTGTVGRGPSAVTGPICSQYAYRNNENIRNEQWRGTAYVALEHDFSDTMSFKADFSYGQTTATDQFQQDGFISAPAIGESSLPANISVNSPGVLYNEGLQPGLWADPDGYRILSSDMLPYLAKNDFSGMKSEVWRIGATLDGDINDTWSWQIGGTYAENQVYGAIKSWDLTPQANGEFKMANALQGLGGPGCDPTTGVPGTGSCQWWNPFMSHALGGDLANSQELTDWMVFDKSSDYDASFYQVSGMLIGELPFELSGGAVGIAVGIERREDDLAADRDDLLNAGLYDRQGVPPNNVGQEDYASTQTVNSVFVELDLPVTETFGIQAAGRYENYEGQFNTFNPKLGFQWAPLDNFTFRGSWGTSFKAPTVIHSDVIQSRASFVNLCDQTVSASCRSGGGSISARTGARTVIAQAGNPDIQPQESDNISVGFDWRVTPELDFGMAYTEIKFDGLIDIPGGTDTVNDPACNAGTVDVAGTATGTEPLFIPLDDSANNHCFRLSPTFDPTNPAAAGGILTAFVNPINLSKVTVRAVDFNLEWNHDFDMGSISFRPNGSYLMDYIQQLARLSDPEQFAGRRGTFGPGWSEWKVNVPLIFTTGDHEVRLTGRYISGQEGVREGSEALESMTWADLIWNWRFSEGMKATLFVNNITNTKPDLVTGFRTTQPRYLRVFGARFQYNWGGN